MPARRWGVRLCVCERDMRRGRRSESRMAMRAGLRGEHKPMDKCFRKFRGHVYMSCCKEGLGHHVQAFAVIICVQALGFKSLDMRLQLPEAQC